MRNFQNIVFIRTQTYVEIFKSAYGEIFKSSVPLKATQNQPEFSGPASIFPCMLRT